MQLIVPQGNHLATTEVGPLDSVGDVSGKNHLEWGLKKNNPDTRLQ
jgi:hypothetical protein